MYNNSNECSKQETLVYLHDRYIIYSSDYSKHSGLIKITPLSGLYSAAIVVYTNLDD